MRNCTISAKNINLTILNIAASPPQASWLALPFWGGMGEALPCAFYMQLVTPSVVATAVRTDITS